MAKSTKSNNKEEIFDLCIIGAGPAGIAAGVYAARKKIKTVLVTGSFESQSTVSDNIQNWIGTISISGKDLTKNLENHLRAYAGDTVIIKDKELVTKIDKSTNKTFIVKTNKSEYKTKTVLVTAGSIRKKLEIKGAEEFENRGITYCATCDGPLFSDMDVAVIGGGNAAFESALQLAAYTKSVTILQRSEFRADPITVKKALSDPKIKGITNVELLEVKGDKFVTGIVYKDKDGKTKTLLVTGIFVEIGARPSVDYLRHGIVKLNDRDQVITDPRTQRTSQEGIWAAGDCTDGLYRQNNIAAGDAIRALENIYYYLKS